MAEIKTVERKVNIHVYEDQQRQRNPDMIRKVTAFMVEGNVRRASQITKSDCVSLQAPPNSIDNRNIAKVFDTLKISNYYMSR